MEQLTSVALAVQVHRAKARLASCKDAHRPASWPALRAWLEQRLACGGGLRAFLLDPRDVLELFSRSCPVEEAKLDRAKAAARRSSPEGLCDCAALASAPQEAERISCRARHLRAETMSAAQIARWALSQSYLHARTPVEGVLAGLAAAGVACDGAGGRVTYDVSAALPPLDAGALRASGLRLPAPVDDAAPFCDAPPPGEAEPPAAAESFDDLGLQADLLQGIYSYGFERPSAIQQRIGPMLRGCHLIARAESGTGKTGAFAIGVLHLVDCRRRACQALILTSGREQAMQTRGVVLALGDHSGVSCHACIGGTSVRGDIDALRRAPHVLVGTVGRVGDMLAKRHLGARHVRVLVLDEADALLRRGSARAVADVRRQLPRELQLCFFSATLPDDAAEQARCLCRAAPRETSEISVGAQMPAALHHFYVGLAEEGWKLDTLCDLYGSIATLRQTVVFCNSRRKADFLGNEMYNCGFAIHCLHAELDQRERDLALGEFRAGTARVLVAAELLERGIDLQQVGLVINYDLPTNSDSYLHRAARAGRFHRSGVVVNLMVCTDGDDELLGDYERDLGISIYELPQDFADLL